MEKLEYLKAVFSEEGADGVAEKLRSMDRDTLRTVTSAAGLSIRAGGQRVFLLVGFGRRVAHVAGLFVFHDPTWVR